MRVCLLVGVVSGFLPVAARGQAALFEDGIAFDMDESTFIYGFWNAPELDRRNVELSAYNGGLYLRGWKQETARGRFDGGVSVFGNPISLVLSDDDNVNHGSFSVWSGTKYASTGADKPFFQIDGDANVAAFHGVAVTVTNGSLSVAGSPVVTAGGLNTALASSTPPTSVAWKAAYVPRGNVSNGAALATGTATASGTSSVAHGLAPTVASGAYSHAAGTKAIASGYVSSALGHDSYASGSYSAAHGTQARAEGNHSLARGYFSFAGGTHSTAVGFYTMAQSYGETVFGRFNQGDPSPNALGWIETDALFRLGNGTDPESHERSDAVTVRKNGETTLTNKAWKEYSFSSPLEVPPYPEAAGGRALVVDGHTLLNGKVTMAEPQGDISMGIYE